MLITMEIPFKKLNNLTTLLNKLIKKLKVKYLRDFLFKTHFLLEIRKIIHM